MKIAILGEKHCKRLFVLKSQDGTDEETAELQRLALHIFKEREAESWYENGDDMLATERRYYQKAKEGDAKSALTFIFMRNNEGYEYEAFDIVEAEEWE